MTKPRAVALALVLSALPAVALAQPSNVDEARRHADAGQAALAANQFQRALSEYQAAYDLFPNSLLLVNVARAQSGLGKNIDAIGTLGRVLEDTSLDPARRGEVEAEVRRLRGLVVELTISVVPEGSHVRVNDSDAGESPLSGPVLADPGPIEVVATHDGYRAGRWSGTLEAGAHRPIAIALEEASSSSGHDNGETTPPPDGHDIVTPPTTPPSHSNTLLWVTGVGAGVTGAVSLAIGGALWSSCGDQKHWSVTEDCAASSSGVRVLADVLGGVAIVSAGVFVYLLATSGDAEESAATVLAEPGIVRF